MKHTGMGQLWRKRSRSNLPGRNVFHKTPGKIQRAVLCVLNSCLRQSLLHERASGVAVAKAAARGSNAHGSAAVCAGTCVSSGSCTGASAGSHAGSGSCTGASGSSAVIYRCAAAGTVAAAGRVSAARSAAGIAAIAGSIAFVIGIAADDIVYGIFKTVCHIICDVGDSAADVVYQGIIISGSGSAAAVARNTGR